MDGAVAVDPARGRQRHEGICAETSQAATPRRGRAQATAQPAHTAPAARSGHEDAEGLVDGQAQRYTEACCVVAV